MEARVQIHALSLVQKRLVIATLLRKGDVAAIRLFMTLTGARLEVATAVVTRLANEIEPGRA